MVYLKLFKALNYIMVFLLDDFVSFTRQRNVTGEIFVNGISRDVRVFRKLNCYILQDDYLLPRLTVKETITMAANLKIPSSVPKEDKKKAVSMISFFHENFTEYYYLRYWNIVKPSKFS